MESMAFFWFVAQLGKHPYCKGDEIRFALKLF